MFLIKVCLNSLKRNPYIVFLIFFSISIVICSILIILSLINSQWNYYKDLDQRHIYSLKTHAELQTMIDLKSEWKTIDSKAKISLLAVTKLPVSYQNVEANYSVSGRDKEALLLDGIDVASFTDNQSILSLSLATKISDGADPKALIGKSIKISGELFEVVEISKDLHLETIFVPYSALSKMSDIMVTTVTIETEEKTLPSILEDLNVYSPTEIDAGQDILKTKLQQSLLKYSGLSILLLVFSLLTFSQLYSFKIKNEQRKWNIFYMLGAQKKHLLATLIIEAGAIIVFSFTIGFSLFIWFINKVYIQNISFLFDIKVLLILIIVFIIFFISVTVQLVKLINKRGDNIVVRISM
jgi:hypothetical protein